MDIGPSVFKLELYRRVDLGNLKQSDLEEVRS